jgi:tetratricopeptide (TPR) repeat protein
VALKPDDGLAWMSLARLLGQLGDFDEAIRCCDSCPTTSPERSKAVPFKAQLLAASGKYHEAVELLACARTLERDAAIEAYEAVRWPGGRADGGKG